MNAIVIFLDPVKEPRGFVEIGRTKELPYFDALNVYANTPNPIQFKTKQPCSSNTITNPQEKRRTSR